MIGRCIGLPGQLIRRWYKEVLSGFTNLEIQTELHQHDTFDPALTNKRTGAIKEVRVPILKPENFGPDMSIDEKMIGDEECTIISNKGTGKIALSATALKVKILADILRKIPAKIRFSVNTLTKDLAHNFDELARTCFLTTVRIADKFHVIKLGLEALQAVRVRYRQQILAEERKKREEQKARERELRETCKKTGEVYHRYRLPEPKAEKYENGETKKELLARSRYLLFRFEGRWSDTQKRRASILFREFPEIKKAYQLVCSFRSFYNCKVGRVAKAKQKLRNWYRKVGQHDIEEVNNFASMVERHSTDILNYFRYGYTNAQAEAINSQIQRFIQINIGVKDKDFFFFRLKNYFS